MGSLTPLFGTNILIDYLNGIPQAKVELGRYDRLAIIIVTWMEIMAGTQPGNITETRSFLSSFACLPITMPIAERAAILRRIEKIKLPDAIILAIVETGNQILVTRNGRDFSDQDPPHSCSLPPLALAAETSNTLLDRQNILDIGQRPSGGDA